VRHSGKPSYTITKRFKLASDIILSFSERPLKFAIGLGVAISVFAFLGSVWIIYGSVKWGFAVIGWPSLITAIFLSTGLIVVIIGISGIYIGEIFKQVKERPLYIIEKHTGS
jgi:dolichol-phosphate mannosyltransferase